MYVYIKTLENKYIFDVNPQHTISDLKYQIQDILKITYEQQRLIFNGTPMENEKSIEKCGVKENGIIHLLLSMV
jgi:hypothetical protein